MVPGDIGAELASALQAMAEAGELPGSARLIGASGTWRPAPPEDGGGPGTYATSLPLAVGRLARRDPAGVAARLAEALEPLPWIASARVTGPGYLTVTVTAGHLAGLPARILASRRGAAPEPASWPDLAAAGTWRQAWNAQHDALLARLKTFDPELQAGLIRPPSPAAPPGPGQGGPRQGGPRLGGPAADAAQWHGADAVRYALARTPGPRPAAIERQLGLPLDLDNPFVRVRYACAHAGATARWATGLADASGLAPGQTGGAGGARGARGGANGAGGARGGANGTAGGADGGACRADGAGGGTAARAAGADAGRAAADRLQADELALIDLLSWRDERLAAAARRGRPAELCAYLEDAARAYLTCAESCPALPFGGAAAPPDPSRPQATARLERAAAAARVLAEVLTQIGVSPPADLLPPDGFHDQVELLVYVRSNST